MNTHKVLDGDRVPEGEFGAFDIMGDPPGSISFTNHSTVTGKITVLGSNDGVNYDNIKRLSARAGETVMRKVKIPLHMKFHNPRPAFGPVTLIVVNAGEEE